MDAAQALADLTEISSQIEAAVLFDGAGAVRGSTLAEERAAEGLAVAAASLLEQADALRTGEAPVTQLEAATAEGCLFVVRDGDRRIAATTVAEPTVGLVFYDLKSCLRDSAAEAEAGSVGGGAADARPEDRGASGAAEKPKRKPRAKKAEADEA